MLTVKHLILKCIIQQWNEHELKWNSSLPYEAKNVCLKLKLQLFCKHETSKTLKCFLPDVNKRPLRSLINHCQHTSNTICVWTDCKYTRDVCFQWCVSLFPPCLFSCRLNIKHFATSGINHFRFQTFQAIYISIQNIKILLFYLIVHWKITPKYVRVY